VISVTRTAAEALSTALPRFSPLLKSLPPGASIAGWLIQNSDQLPAQVVQALIESPVSAMRTWTSARAMAAMCVADVMEMAGDDLSAWPLKEQNQWTALITSRIVRFCPACIRDGMPHQKYWLVDAVTACTRHGFVLENLFADHERSDGHVNSDHSPYSWRGFALWPKAWALTRMMQARAATAPALRLARFVEARLMSVRPPSDVSYPVQLETMAIPELLRLLAFAGRIGNGPNVTVKISAATMTEVSIQTAEQCDSLFHGWPTNVGAYFRTLQRVINPGVEVPTIQKAYGPFYNYLYEHFGQQHFRFLREKVVDFILEEYPGRIDKRHRRLATEGDLGKAAYLDGAAAARKLNIGTNTLVSLIEANLLPGHVLRGDRLLHARVLVPKSEIHRAAEIVGKLSTVREICAAHGISKNIYGALTRAGLIQPPSSCLAARQLVIRSQIDGLFNLIGTHASRTPCPAQVISLMKAAEIVALRNLPTYLRDLFERPLPFWRGNSAKRPLDVWVSIDDVLAWKKHRGRILAGDRLTLPQFAREFGLKEEVVYQLMGKGLIAVSRERVNFREEAFITPAASGAFFDKYVLLAKRIGRSRSGRHAAKHLTGIGIRAIFGPEIDGTRQYVYERTAMFETEITRYLDAKIGARDCA